MGDDLVVEQYRKKNEYETLQLDNEWVILNTDDYTVTKLNDMGGYCWALLQEPQSIDSLIQSVHEKYQLKELTQKDIKAFLLELIEYGLVQHAV